MPIITLTTDFGTRDHYVAAMKGVLLARAPKATLVDVTHDVPPAGLMHAAFILAQLPVTFPPETVHLAVIDPTVGTRRGILAAKAGGQFFIAPDNGLLTLVEQRWGLERLTLLRPMGMAVTDRISDTFHGRDLMAPAAAMLAAHGRLEELGPPTDRMQLLHIPAPAIDQNQTRGQVIHIDRFGNCTTNITKDILRDVLAYGGPPRITAGDADLGPPLRTYADVAPGEPLALIGSADLLEIAVNLGSAAEQLKLAVGSEVIVRQTS